MLKCTALKGRGKEVLTDGRCDVGLDVIGQMDAMGFQDGALQYVAKACGLGGWQQGRAHRQALCDGPRCDWPDGCNGNEMMPFVAQAC